MPPDTDTAGITPPDPTTPDTEPGAANDDAPLQPAGQKALEVWKQRARTAEAEAKRLAAIEAELAELRKGQMTDHERAIATAREEARTEALGAVNGRIFAAELRAATAGKLLDSATQDLLVDNTVALRLLGLDEYPVTATGDIDREAISQAVTAYVAARPHLAASATQTPGSVDQGARTTPPTKTLDDMIAEAEAAGNYRLSGQLKTQKMLAAKRG